MPLFFDIEALTERQTDGLLEYVYKAVGEHDHDDGIWSEHWSPFLQRIVALFTERGLTRLEAVRSELSAWMAGDHHKPGALLPRPDGSMIRWAPAELKLVKLYLESLPVDAWTLDDHMLMVDMIAQKHLPADDLRTEAEWLASRAVIMGKVQANMENLTAEQVDKLLQAMPGFVRDDQRMTPVQRKVMEFSVNRACENVTSLADSARHQMRGIVARHVEAQELGGGGPSLQTELMDTFGALNRDWRRIAVTEATDAQGNGFIASQQIGTKVKRFEHYKNACSFCRKLDGMVFTVVDPSTKDKDGWASVWVGKSNIGRSSAPRKRQGDILVSRDESEMWWPSAGAQHPHCRGAWLPTIQDAPSDDPEFSAWIREQLKEAE